MVTQDNYIYYFNSASITLNNTPRLNKQPQKSQNEEAIKHLTRQCLNRARKLYLLCEGDMRLERAFNWIA